MWACAAQKKCDLTCICPVVLGPSPRAASNKGSTYHALPLANTTSTGAAHMEQEGRGEPTTVEK